MEWEVSLPFSSNISMSPSKGRSLDRMEEGAGVADHRVLWAYGTLWSRGLLLGGDILVSGDIEMIWEEKHKAEFALTLGSLSKCVYSGQAMKPMPFSEKPCAFYILKSYCCGMNCVPQNTYIHTQV